MGVSSLFFMLTECDYTQSQVCSILDVVGIDPYWEDLIAAAPSICDHPDSGLLVRWARNKSELLGKPAFDFAARAGFGSAGAFPRRGKPL